MNAKISVFVIRVEAIIYLLLYNLHDCTFNYGGNLCLLLQITNPTFTNPTLKTKTLKIYSA